MESVPGLINKLEPDVMIGTEIPNPTVIVAPTPTPPVTINAPVVGDVEAVDAVTANPETDSISVNGLKKNVLSLDTAEPEDEEDGVNNTG